MSTEQDPIVYDADEALARLIVGNERFVSGQARPGPTDPAAELVAGQRPYAAVHLRTPLFMILGHEGCGAVAASLAALRQGAAERSRIQILLESIKPGLEGIPADTPPEDLLRTGVEANVRWSMHQLLDTPEGRARLAEGQLKLVGAVYELATGRVRLLA